MEWFKQSFRERLNLEHEEVLKIFFFIFKGISAIGFLFILGYLWAGSPLGDVARLVLVLSAAVDLAPEIITLRVLGYLPEKARQAEKLQLLLTAAAYLLLASIFLGLTPNPLLAYTAFTALWLLSFLVEESVVFLVRSE
ncbi:MAG: hypothetical protein ABEJ62_00735 [Candidatus Nanohaloarchaea archaeon]